MNPAVIAVFVPIIAIIFGVAVAIVSITGAHRQRMQRAELRHRERLAAIEKGLELPPDPPDSESPSAPRRPRHLLRGLVLLFGGAALTAAIRQDQGPDSPYLYGLIAVAAGLAYLIYYFIEGREEVRREEARRANATPPAELPPR